jgi:hypothetical protein
MKRWLGSGDNDGKFSLKIFARRLQTDYWDSENSKPFLDPARHLPRID